MRWDTRSQLVAGTIIVSVLIAVLLLGGQVVGGLAGLGGLIVAWIAAWVGWRAAGRDLAA
jgi:hypothetical protein